MSSSDFQQLQWMQQDQLREQEQVRQQQDRSRQQQPRTSTVSRRQDSSSRRNSSASKQEAHAPSLRGQGWIPEAAAIAQHETIVRAPGGDTGRVVGVARAVNQRFEQSVLHRQNQIVVWTFRVERHDEEGHSLPPVPVELRGLNFKGVVSEGDWVDVGRRWRPGTVVRTRSVRNLTTGDRLRVTGRGPRALGLLFALLLIAAWCTFAVLLVLGRIHP